MQLNIWGFEVVNNQALVALTAGLLACAVAGIRAIDKRTPRIE